MLFPEDPKKRPDIWLRLLFTMSNEEFSWLIKDGSPCTPIEKSILSEQNAKYWIESQKQADVVRLVTSHGSSVTSCLACKKIEDTLYALNLISLPFDDDWKNTRHIENIIECFLIDIFFTEKNIDSIVFPIPLDPWRTEGFFMEKQDGALLIKRSG